MNTYAEGHRYIQIFNNELNSGSIIRLYESSVAEKPLACKRFTAAPQFSAHRFYMQVLIDRVRGNTA
ncbi:hypothetical protein KL913_000544 [Ogataea haglerorum]|nr:hypothetical protein KL913_000544 [Ogataea haglerorum]